MRLPRRTVTVSIVAILVAGLIVAGSYFLWLERRRAEHAEPAAAQKPQAPPDIARYRESFAAGLAALQRNDGADAVKHLGSFDFSGRAVEEYRLYYLANGYELANDVVRQRGTLAKLWRRDPNCVCGDVTGQKLSALYAESGDWSHSARVARVLAARTKLPASAASARWRAIEAQFYGGDVAGALDAARAIAVKSPLSSESAAAIALIRSVASLPKTAAIPLSPVDRLERGVSLLRDGEPTDAFDEITALDVDAPESMRLPIQLNRGLALNQMRRFEDSNKVLEPLSSGPFKYAIPAIYTAAKNYRVLSASINPTVSKTVTEKKRVGSVKVRVGKGKKGRLVTKPKYVNVKRTIQLVDLAKKAKKEEYARLGTERLKDLLQIRETAPELRLEALNALIGVAESKNQDAYEKELIAQVIVLDRNADPGLQRFWNKGWTAYLRGDLPGAKEQFRFVNETYVNPNVKRQSRYWYARTIERAGQKEEAKAIYREIASVPYEDVYALYAESRGAPRPKQVTNPLTQQRRDWRDIAEKTMPPELRLAYELTALSDMRDAQLEIQRNANSKNQRLANALLADLYNSRGDLQLLYRTIRRAYPQLATVEQDSVPPYFLKMYYPIKYEKAIKQNAKKNAIDPYLVMAVILQESYFDPSAKSRVGATGLMQLMPATGKEIGRKLHGVFSVPRLEDPETNIELGTFHLKHLLQLFNGNTQLVVASYNAGQGNVLKWRRAAPSKPMDEFLESIPFPETRNYVKRVTLLRSSYSRMAQ